MTEFSCEGAIPEKKKRVMRSGKLWEIVRRRGVLQHVCTRTRWNKQHAQHYFNLNLYRLILT